MRRPSSIRKLNLPFLEPFCPSSGPRFYIFTSMFLHNNVPLRRYFNMEGIHVLAVRVRLYQFTGLHFPDED